MQIDDHVDAIQVPLRELVARQDPRDDAPLVDAAVPEVRITSLTPDIPNDRDAL
jgi:hypothetical protein